MSENDQYRYLTPDGVLYYFGGDLANCTIEACPVELSVYGYRASLPASATLIGLYAVCMVIHLWYGWKYKTWGFLLAMLLGCLVEILGYAGRIMMWDNPWADGGFIMQIVLITIGPVFFSAAIYVLLSQIVEYISAKYSRFQPKFFYWIFIPCDIVSLILQAAGGAMSSTSNGDSDVGVNIALAGLAFQVATLVAFIALTIDYLIRSRPVWTSTRLPSRFLLFCSALSLATLVILIRCSYRVYELSEGYSRDSEALRDENLFIGLESVMVVISAYALILAHPGPVFHKNRQNEEDTEEKAAQLGHPNITIPERDE